jgi:two-component system, sensor histidine kinase
MLRILTVDDNPTNLDLTSRMLLRAGYSVDTATNGEDAVAMAGLWRYDLIVMDMSMPGIGGGEATRRIRSAEKSAGTRRVPVVAFTANAVEDFRQSAMRSDMDDFITKPIERRQLLAAVERSIDDRLVVLVADDCTADRERTARYLRAIDRLAVVAVRTGAEAITACLSQRISLGLINLTLPDISGIEAAHQIHKSRYGESIGIIAISDKIDPEARKHSIRHGYVGYLEKPIVQNELLGLLRPLVVTA